MTAQNPFQREAACRVQSGEIAPFRSFFRQEKPELTMEVVLRFRGFTRVVLKENPDSYGLYFINPSSPVPFLWFGLAWSTTDPPGALPSWGASLEVDGGQVASFLENAGGLLDACRAVATAEEEIQLHHFEHHVELAQWHDFEWLLAQRDQRRALMRYWAGYLRALAEGGIPHALKAFTMEAGIA